MATYDVYRRLKLQLKIKHTFRETNIWFRGPEKDYYDDDYNGGNNSTALAKCARVVAGAGEGDEMK